MKRLRFPSLPDRRERLPGGMSRSIHPGAIVWERKSRTLHESHIGFVMMRPGTGMWEATHHTYGDVFEHASQDFRRRWYVIEEGWKNAASAKIVLEAFHEEMGRR